MIVKDDHDDAGYVKRGKGRVNDKVVVVEHAHRRIADWRVVQAEHYRRADCGRYEPNEPDREPNPFVVLVPGVFDRLGYRNVPVIMNIIEKQGNN